MVKLWNVFKLSLNYANTRNMVCSGSGDGSGNSAKPAMIIMTRTTAMITIITIIRFYFSNETSISPYAPERASFTRVCVCSLDDVLNMLGHDLTYPHIFTIDKQVDTIKNKKVLRFFYVLLVFFDISLDIKLLDICAMCVFRYIFSEDYSRENRYYNSCMKRIRNF